MAEKSDAIIPKEALAYLRAKKFATGFDHRDIWRDAHATAFTVAKAMQIDVLESIRDALDQALAEGRTFDQFRKDLTPTLQRLGWWGEQDEVDPVTGETRTVQLGSPRRLKTIYDTNMTIAYQSGQWQRIQRSKAAFPYLKYVLGPSKEHRPEHAAWAGTILPVDDPWWTTHRPRNGWGCQCDVVALTEIQAKREGISDAPPIKTRKWENARTGEIVNVPVGIDPGWDFNPGEVAHEEYSARIFGIKIMTASADVGSLAIQSSVDYVRLAMRRDFRRWVETAIERPTHTPGESRLISVVKADVVDLCKKRGLTLGSAAITITDQTLNEHLRQDQRAPISKNEMLTMAERLDDPKAVLLDMAGQVLVYIYAVKDRRLAKVVIQPAWSMSRNEEEKRKKFRTNAIVSVDIVERKSLVAGNYDVIKGKL